MAADGCVRLTCSGWQILRTLTDIAGRNATNTVRADARAAREREAGVLSERKERYLEIGVGVSRAGQEVFDTLKKNFPVKWINESVRIFDSVTLLPPYGVDNIRYALPHTSECCFRETELTSSAARRATRT